MTKEASSMLELQPGEAAMVGSDCEAKTFKTLDSFLNDPYFLHPKLSFMPLLQPNSCHYLLFPFILPKSSLTYWY